MTNQQISSGFFRETTKQFFASFALLAIFALTLPIGANAQQMDAKRASASNAVLKPLTQEQKILHVLNRLSYGVKSGDVEKVKQIGLDNYIEQQLNPMKIDDSTLEAKLQKFDALKMSNTELFAKYANPGAILQAVAKQNGLNRRDLQGMRQKNQDAKNGGAMENDAMTSDEMKKSDDGAMMRKPGANAANNTLIANLTDEQRQQYQEQVRELYVKYDLRRPAEMTQQLNSSRILRAVYSEKQLQEEMVDFWSNHFNVYANKAAVRWYLPEYDRDVIRPNALGNFKDLVIATAKSPAMLFYLDNFQSVAPQSNKNNGRNIERLAKMAENGRLPERAKERIRSRFPNATDEEIVQRLKQMQGAAKRERGINENYARELMELHTLGVDSGYTQKDVQEIARCFTGWTIVDARGYRKSVERMIDGGDNNMTNAALRRAGFPENAESGTFHFNEKQHDNGEKIVLGQTIKSGGGMKDGLQVIDILMKQPSTAKFIARKLAVKFVSDNPSDAFVNRIADAFSKSNGDIKTTLRAIFTDKEFFAPENYRAKIKTPFEVVASTLRVLNADTNASPQMQNLLNKMGEPLYGYQAPTGYPDTARDWVNTGALLQRLNFGLAVSSNRIAGTKVNLTKFAGTQLDDKQAVMDKFINVILNGEISPNTKATLAKQINQPIPEPTLANEKSDDSTMENDAMMQNNANGRRGQNQQVRLLPPSGNAEVNKIVGLILGSPDFQRQ